MPFNQVNIPELSKAAARQAKADLFNLDGCDGYYLDQLTDKQRACFARLRDHGLAELEFLSKMRNEAHAKVRINDEVLVKTVE